MNRPRITIRTTVEMAYVALNSGAHEVVSDSISKAWSQLRELLLQEPDITNDTLLVVDGKTWGNLWQLGWSPTRVNG